MGQGQAYCTSIIKAHRHTLTYHTARAAATPWSLRAGFLIVCNTRVRNARRCAALPRFINAHISEAGFRKCVSRGRHFVQVSSRHTYTHLHITRHARRLHHGPCVLVSLLYATHACGMRAAARRFHVLLTLIFQRLDFAKVLAGAGILYKYHQGTQTHTYISHGTRGGYTMVLACWFPYCMQHTRAECAPLRGAFTFY